MSEVFTQPEERTPRRPAARRSIFWPLLLISIGVVFLLRNVGILQGEGFDVVMSLWPLVLILMGIDSFFQREGVAGPVFLVGLGLVFLLNNLNLVVWDVWGVVLRLWPVLLVAIGLDLIFSRRSAVGSLLSIVILAAVLGGSLWFLGVEANSQLPREGQEIYYALEDAESVSVDLRPGVGTVWVHALPGDSRPGTLVQGTASLMGGETLEQSYTVAQGSGRFSLASSGIAVTIPAKGPDASWELRFSPVPVLDLQVSLGMGQLDLNLEALSVKDLDVDLGMGSMRVVLPATGAYDARINGAMGQMVIVIPAGLEARIEIDSAFTAVDVPAEFERVGDSYESAGFDEAEARVELHLTQPFGRILIQRGP